MKIKLFLYYLDPFAFWYKLVVDAKDPIDRPMVDLWIKFVKVNCCSENAKQFHENIS